MNRITLDIDAGHGVGIGVDCIFIYRISQNDVGDHIDPPYSYPVHPDIL